MARSDTFAARYIEAGVNETKDANEGSPVLLHSSDSQHSNFCSPRGLLQVYQVPTVIQVSTRVTVAYNQIYGDMIS